jgi:hypothetical protein
MHESSRRELEFQKAPGLPRADRRRDGRRHGSDRRAEQRGEGQAQGQDAVLAGGKAVAGARARELHAGLCRLDRERGREAGRLVARRTCRTHARPADKSN